MWEESIVWRREFSPNSITFESLQPIISQNLVFLHKQDKEGRPCCVILHRNQTPEDDIGLITKSFLYMVDIAAQYSDVVGSRKLVVIYD